MIDRFEHAETIAATLAARNGVDPIDDRKLRDALDAAVVALLCADTAEPRAA